MPSHTLTAAPFEGFSNPKFAGITEGLLTEEGPAGPFALSYDIEDANYGAYVIPRVNLWSGLTGHVSAIELGSHTPDLAASWGVKALDFLGWSELFKAAENILGNIYPDSQRQTYRVALTARGAVLVAELPRSVGHDHGYAAIAAAICPPGLSAHDKLATGDLLTKAIRAILREEDQDIPGRQPPVEITVTVA